jgi:DNA-binding transcriptional regulator YhcF (GntR family)
MFAGKTASEIFDNIRHLVQSGGLQPGEVLPPVRELASQLAVNRNTVAAAYKRLVTSGLAVSRDATVRPLKHGIRCRRWRAVTHDAAERYLQRQSGPRQTA